MIAKRKGRFQFGLKTLFIFVSCSCFLLGYASINAHNVAALRTHIAAIGGNITFTYEVDRDGTTTVAPTHPVPKFIRTWIGDDFGVTPYAIEFGGQQPTVSD